MAIRLCLNKGQLLKQARPYYSSKSGIAQVGYAHKGPEVAVLLADNANLKSFDDEPVSCILPGNPKTFQDLSLDLRVIAPNTSNPNALEAQIGSVLPKTFTGLSAVSVAQEDMPQYVLEYPGELPIQDLRTKMINTQEIVLDDKNPIPRETLFVNKNHKVLAITKDDNEAWIKDNQDKAMENTTFLASCGDRYSRIVRYFL